MLPTTSPLTSTDMLSGTGSLANGPLQIDTQQPINVLLPLLLLAGGLLSGLLVEHVLASWLHRRMSKRRWMSAQVVRGLRGFVTLWFTVGGLYLATLLLPLEPLLQLRLSQLLFVITALSVTIGSARIAAGIVEHSMRRSGALALWSSTTIFSNVTKIVVLLLGMLITLQSLRISITPILTALGVGGLAVALALQDTLANLFAGLQLLVARQLKPGDYVRLDTTEEGWITDITWRTTTIRTLPNSLVVVPNTKIASAIVTNYHLPQADLSVLVPVRVSYDSDLQRVERVSCAVGKEVMEQVPGGVPSFDPFIRYNNLGDYGIDFNVILRAAEFADQYLLKHEFIKRLHRRFRDEGIDIPFPITTVRLPHTSERMELERRSEPELVEARG